MRCVSTASARADASLSATPRGTPNPARKHYALRLVEGRPTRPPLIVKNRPRELVFNLGHGIFGGRIREVALEMVMALEVAYLLGGGRTGEDLYDRVLELLTES